VRYPSFFENFDEASMRLRSTIVMERGEPVEVAAVTFEGNQQNLFAYVYPIGWEKGEFKSLTRPDVSSFGHYGGPEITKHLDDWIKKNKGSSFRKVPLGSPTFNQFRPFPLGMCNDGPYVFYNERVPNRRVEQGLISTMLKTYRVSVEKPDGGEPCSNVLYFYGPSMRACILAEHPSAHRCLEGLKDPKHKNQGAAFHRYFALIKGQADTLYLAYKNDIIGSLPYGDFGLLKLDRQYSYTKEVVADLKLFQTITI
jgi:hypothetical protein